MRPTILATDAKGTLISNPMRQTPPPGRDQSLDSATSLFVQLVFFTTAPQPHIRPRAATLA